MGCERSGQRRGCHRRPPRIERGLALPRRQVTGQSLHHGLWGGQDRSTLFLCYVVDDVNQAVERVRAAGGQADAPTEAPYGRVRAAGGLATDPDRQPYGITSDCTDDQGTHFYLGQM